MAIALVVGIVFGGLVTAWQLSEWICRRLADQHRNGNDNCGRRTDGI